MSIGEAFGILLGFVVFGGVVFAVFAIVAELTNTRIKGKFGGTIYEPRVLQHYKKESESSSSYSQNTTSKTETDSINIVSDWTTSGTIDIRKVVNDLMKTDEIVWKYNEYKLEQEPNAVPLSEKDKSTIKSKIDVADNYIQTYKGIREKGEIDEAEYKKGYIKIVEFILTS